MVQEMTRIPEQVIRTNREEILWVLEGIVSKGVSRSVRSMSNRPRGGHRLLKRLPKEAPFGKHFFGLPAPPAGRPRVQSRRNFEVLAGRLALLWRVVPPTLTNPAPGGRRASLISPRD